MSVARYASRFAAGTAMSRVLGLVRDKCVAHVFGATMLMDAFNVAYRIPNLFRDMLAEGALNSSFTKVYSQAHAEDPERAKKLLGEALTLVGAFAALFSAAGILSAPWFVRLMTMFESRERGADFLLYTTSLTRLFFPFIGLMMLGALFMGVLHHRGRFFTSSISSIGFNIGYILGALVLSALARDHGPPELQAWFGDPMVFGLALGVLLGGVLQVGWQLWGILPVLRRECVWQWPWPPSRDLVKMLMLMGPIVITAGSGQINVIINTNFATQLAAGTVTVMTNALHLWQLPIALFAVGLGNAILPSLVKMIAGGDRLDGPVSDRLRQALILTAWFMIASASFFAGNAYEICSLIFQSGAYTREATELTALVLRGYCVGLLFYGLVKVLSSVYVALDRARFAMICSLGGILVNIIANATLVHRFGAIGLALSASLVLGLNAILLLIGLQKSGIRLFQAAVIKHGAFIVLAAALSLAAQIPLGAWINELAGSGTAHPLIGWLAAAAINGILTTLIFAVFAMKAYAISPLQMRQMLKKRRS